LEMSFSFIQLTFKHCDLFVTTWSFNVPFGAGIRHEKNC